MAPESSAQALPIKARAAPVRFTVVGGRPHQRRAARIYSLRHAAICKRLILSTQSIRSNSFYVRNLPLSKEIAINLQSFGGDEAP
jgi:hypothetical protein